MTMEKKAQKRILTKFIQTETNSFHSDKSTKINLNQDISYYIKPVERVDYNYDAIAGVKQTNSAISFNLYPVVLDSEGIPWPEANIYILDKIKNSLKPNMLTFSNIASDLVAYRQFLDDSDIDWLKFEKNKLYRPTYRYRAYLRTLIESKLLSISTAKRRMSSVISFYRYLHDEKVFTPENPTWKNKEYYIDIKSNYGIPYVKKVSSTDISIHQPKPNPLIDETIMDGGQLKPLSKEEQVLLINALLQLGNIEMLLIHLVALASGARIQTILTFRLHHFKKNLENSNLLEIKIPAGIGTDIDTKNDKKMVLHIPLWLYQKLHIYSISENAAKRRAKSLLGNADTQYLFLTNRGMPYYQSKKEMNSFDQEFSLHHMKNGQTVRQFIKDKIIPFIQKEKEGFTYRFHDLRATFGMNLTDQQLEYVTTGEKSLNEAREFVRVRMCHESSATTDLYLKYRQNSAYIREVSSAYSDFLENLVNELQMRIV